MFYDISRKVRKVVSSFALKTVKIIASWGGRNGNKFFKLFFFFSDRNSAEVNFNGKNKQASTIQNQVVIINKNSSHNFEFMTLGWGIVGF